MRSAILYAIIAAGILTAIMYYRKKGPERIGWFFGITLAALVALFSDRIILIPNSLAQTIAMFVAIAIGIVMLSVLANKLIGHMIPIMAARKKEQRRQAMLEAAEAEWEQKKLEEQKLEQLEQTETAELEAPAVDIPVIDIETERKRRQVKRPFNEEYFYEQSEPLEAGIEEDFSDLQSMDGDWMQAAEAEQINAIKAEFLFENRKNAIEAGYLEEKQAVEEEVTVTNSIDTQLAAEVEESETTQAETDELAFAVIPDESMEAYATDEAEVEASGDVDDLEILEEASGELSDTTNVDEVSDTEADDSEQDEESPAMEIAVEEAETDADEGMELDDHAIDLLDRAWRHRDAGEWKLALQAYDEFCREVSDTRLQIEVQVEALGTMMAAEMYDEATDKVFELLTYEKDLSEKEQQQIIKVLEHMQTI